VHFAAMKVCSVRVGTNVRVKLTDTFRACVRRVKRADQVKVAEFTACVYKLLLL